jgi:hypothetical protein
MRRVGKMFPKKGKVFPGGNDRENDKRKYAEMIAVALRAELGATHRATKTVMRWTGASERTVKNWLSGLHGPGGEHLIVLMRESETMLETVLAAADRRDAIVAARMLAAHGTMVEAMALVEQERTDLKRADALGVGRPGGEVARAPDDPENDRVIDPVVNPTSGDGLNPRQHWYLEALASGQDVRVSNLQRRWGVSEKTARRDVAALKARGMIEFVGSFRTGRYRLGH